MKIPMKNRTVKTFSTIDEAIKFMGVGGINKTFCERKLMCLGELGFIDENEQKYKIVVK